MTPVCWKITLVHTVQIVISVQRDRLTLLGASGNSWHSETNTASLTGLGSPRTCIGQRVVIIGIDTEVRAPGLCTALSPAAHTGDEKDRLIMVLMTSAARVLLRSTYIQHFNYVSDRNWSPIPHEHSDCLSNICPVLQMIISIALSVILARLTFQII